MSTADMATKRQEPVFTGHTNLFIILCLLWTFLSTVGSSMMLIFGLFYNPTWFGVEMLYGGRVIPEHDDLLCCILPPLVLLQADVAAVLSRVEPPSDCCTQVSQGPVEVMVQQTGGCFKQCLQQKLSLFKTVAAPDKFPRRATIVMMANRTRLMGKITIN